ncbi:hypothetical protein [Leifsonia xyli]|uniref:hypothetical protein n=1 Tax=Leifsonia xyli TaxID=1575 RepID=UPI0012DBCC8C|nr:hypothetical protein [Leifsonia xyli]
MSPLLGAARLLPPASGLLLKASLASVRHVFDRGIATTASRRRLDVRYDGADRGDADP